MREKSALALLVCLALLLWGPPASAEAGECLPYETDLTAAETEKLTDGSYKTDLLFTPKTTVTLTSETPVGALYLVYGTYPEAWTLTAGERHYACGEQGFLHELVRLDEPETHLCLELPDMELRLCELYAFPPGELPAWVQDWQQLTESADLLLFSTHADDELLFFGGLSPYYSAVRGLKVQVCYMTTNYYARNDYRFRPHESLDGLWRAGARYYPVTQMVDDVGCDSLAAAEFFYGEDGFAEFETEQLRRFRPLVAVTLAESGEYGHGAHILTALSLERAAEAAGDAAQFPESAARYGTWDVPKTYLHSYGAPEDSTMLNFEEPSEALGGLTPFETAREAYKLHRTQQEWSFTVYGSNSAWDCHRYGLYRSLVGEDREKDDLMENVVSGQ